MNKLGHFITYWGDIYSGTLYEVVGYEESFFIVPNYNLSKIHELSNEERTADVFRRLGWEIRDHRVIKSHYIGDNGNSLFNEERPKSISFSDQKFRKMFVFGAGASTFCCFGKEAERFKDEGLRPPIGYEIFHERYDHIIRSYPGVQFSIPEFESKNNNIEECLEEEWSKYRSNYNPQIAMRHMNVQYYLQDLLCQVSRKVSSIYFRRNLYSLFVNKIQNYCSIHEEERPTFVSFNYDTILENFVELAFGPKYESTDDYIDWHNRNVVIFKPHGSSNWGWEFPHAINAKIGGQKIHHWLYEMKLEPYEVFYELLGDVRQMVNSYSYGYELDGSVNGLSKHGLNKQRIQIVKKDRNYYPAMLLPYRDKDEFIMPYNHMMGMDSILPKIEQMFLIGWKGSEDLFNRKLRNLLTNCKELIIVNPDSKSVKENLESYLDLSSIDIKEIKSFEEFVLRDLDDFLRESN